jgi:hypothetical protein
LKGRTFRGAVFLGLRAAEQIGGRFGAAHVVEDILFGPKPFGLAVIAHARPAVKPAISLASGGSGKEIIYN